MRRPWLLLAVPLLAAACAGGASGTDAAPASVPPRPAEVTTTSAAVEPLRATGNTSPGIAETTTTTTVAPTTAPGPDLTAPPATDDPAPTTTPPMTDTPALAAQTDLRNASTVAGVLYNLDSSLIWMDAVTMSDIEPSLSYVDGIDDETPPGVIQVAVADDDQSATLVTVDAQGTAWCLRWDIGVYSYGSGATAETASLACDLPEWPAA